MSTTRLDLSPEDAARVAGLAVAEAFRRHDAAWSRGQGELDGHPTARFETCAHRDCVLTQRLVETSKETRQ